MVEDPNIAPINPLLRKTAKASQDQPEQRKGDLFMSWTGVWSVGCLPQKEAHAFLSKTRGNEKLSVPERRHVRRQILANRGSSPPEREAISELIEDIRSGQWDDDISDTVADTLEPEPLPPFVFAARKLDPSFALYFSLNEKETDILPGFFGQFVLPPEGTAMFADKMENVVAPGAANRDTLLVRVGEYAKIAGDEPDFDATRLVDGFYSFMRSAAEQKRAVAGVLQRF
ncbi:hypothetical protein [Nocardiopsis composta]|uniref:Uncharacterized protein n=1 Tax=Nocardiopsis composta TaxID=157465 RepID=A0A7W8VG36_9ACTN|nr:hypothetical protein [Nocardiopsis composta]MBB5434604.1 hypothetical protein [Nocardiopsis composta]